MERLDEKDPILWRIAKKSAGFKRSLYGYLAVNAFFWLIWLYTDHNYYSGITWPVWPMLGWGLGISLQYYDAYYSSKGDVAESEYEKDEAKEAVRLWQISKKNIFELTFGV